MSNRHKLKKYHRDAMNKLLQKQPLDEKEKKLLYDAYTRSPFLEIERKKGADFDLFITPAGKAYLKKMRKIDKEKKGIAQTSFFNWFKERQSRAEKRGPTAEPTEEKDKRHEKMRKEGLEDDYSRVKKGSKWVYHPTGDLMDKALARYRGQEMTFVKRTKEGLCYMQTLKDSIQIAVRKRDLVTVKQYKALVKENPDLPRYIKAKKKKEKKDDK